MTAICLSLVVLMSMFTWPGNPSSSATLASSPPELISLDPGSAAVPAIGGWAGGGMAPSALSIEISEFFIRNDGQIRDANVLFYQSFDGFSIGFGVSEIYMIQQPIEPREDQAARKRTFSFIDQDDEATPPGRSPRSELIRIHFAGSNAVMPEGRDPSLTLANFFLGNDSKNWRTGVPTFAEVSYPNLYPGVQLVYRAEKSGPKYDFILSPGTDPRTIVAEVEGLKSLSIGSDGSLLMHAEVGEIVDSAPLSDQDGAPVTCAFFLLQEFSYGFDCPSWDRSAPLRIDPLIHTTILGGSGEDDSAALHVDPSGAVIFYGSTSSSDFPLSGTPFGNLSAPASYDVFIAKINPAGDAYVFLTFIGGSSDEFASYGRIAADSAGNLFLTGDTYSSDFPTTPGAVDDSLGGSEDGFVLKISPGGDLVFSTFYGGSEGDWCTGIDVNALDYVFVGCVTESADFPVTAGAFKMNLSGPLDSAIFKLSPDGRNREFGTYLGGDGRDYLNGLILGPSDEIYVAGGTESSNFPMVGPSFDRTFNGDSSHDAYIARFDADVSRLLSSTFIGGSYGDVIYAFVVDDDGNVFATGDTNSSDFPTSPGAYNAVFKAGWSPGVPYAGDGFVIRLNASLSTLGFSTFVGGTGVDDAFGIAVDSLGNSYVTGQTYSSDFPTTTRALDSSLNGSSDGFFLKLNAKGNGLVYSTFLGGTDEGEFGEYATSVQVDSYFNAYVTGYFQSTLSFIGSDSSNLSGNRSGNSADGYLLKFALATPQNLEVTPLVGLGKLTWETPWPQGGVAIAGYRIYAREVPGAYGSPGTIGNLTAYSSHVVGGRRFCYEVTAVAGTNETEPTEEVCIVGATLPGAPVSLAAASGDGSVSLSWSAPNQTGGPPIVAYTVFRGTDPGNLTNLTTLGAEDWFNDSNLTNGVTYYYEVSAWNYVWEGVHSTNASATPVGRPSPPRGLVVEVGDSRLRLTWTAPEYTGGVGISGYYLLRGTGSQAPTLYQTLPPQTQFTDTGLVNGEAYTYQVVAFNQMWNSTASEAAAAVPGGVFGSIDTGVGAFAVFVFAAGAAGLVVVMRRRRMRGADAPLGGVEPRESSGPSAQFPEPSGGPQAVGLGAASASPFAATSHLGVVTDAQRDRPTFLVENVFLLYNDGRNMFASGALGIDAIEDPELVGTMLVAVQDFIKDSFRRGANVDRMGYGDSSILIERGGHVILAVTVFGSPPPAFRELMSDTVEKVQGTFAGMIEKWDGNKTALRGIEGLLAPLWVPTLDLTHDDILLATTAREVHVRSGVEFFQGFVRLKVSVVNSTTSVITGASIDLDYDHDALRLHKIEPSTYRTEGAKVNLAVINTGEKKTVAYYFDPQICTSTAIDGACRFKDPDGNVHTVQMKSRKAEVVCPLFFTQEQANTAMLKRLVEEELKLYDVKGYSFKTGIAREDLHNLFEAVKSTVRAHDVVLVRSFERKEPYLAEAWFYGRTQKRRDPIVIRGVVDSANARVEFYAASGAIRSVTGLLAEFHHTFDAKVKDEFGDFGVQPLFDETLRRGYSDPAVVAGLIAGDEESAP